MFERIIGFSIRNPLIIAIGVTGLIVWGVVSFQRLPIDAVPDITNNQVQVVTLTPALAPQEVERLITIPVEQTMATIDGITERRSVSRFGLSVVTLVFEDDIDIYWARAQVDQRLTEAKEMIPADAGTPMMMPITTGLGEIYQYRLEVDKDHTAMYDPMSLRTIHEWMVRRRLLGSPGVADVASFGGFLRQAEIAVVPERLRSFGLSIADILDAVQRNNANAGGAYIEKGPNLAYIRTEGMATSNTDLENIVVGTTNENLPILVRDIAEVRDGHAVRYGAMTYNDSGEAVGGIVYMLKGANSSEVIETVKERMKAIEASLPEGLHIAPFLDRSKLVNKAISTVATNLIEGALIVIFVLVLMLGNMRAGLIVASVIPLSMLFAIGMMTLFGVSGNLMSLGAIDFGLIVDGAVIVVEHVLHKLSGQGWKGGRVQSSREIVQSAAVEIRRSAAFGEFIILIVYFPILTLVGIEGKMFGPMAQTVVFAILGAFILSTTYVPMMASLLLKQQTTHKVTFADRIMKLIERLYTPVRNAALRRVPLLLTSAIALFALSLFGFFSLGGEFIPTLDEGDFAVETRLITGSSLSETIKTTQQAAAILKKNFPEVISVVGKIGTTEIPMDPMPIESGDLIVVLKDKKEWTSATTREELAGKMQEALSTLPGIAFGFQQPIQMRFNELMTGARQDVVIKVYGEDLDSLVHVVDRIGAIAQQVQGAADVYKEPVSGLPQIVVRADREACALLGVNIDDVNSTIRAAFAGELAGNVYEQEKRFDVVVRLRAEDRTSITDLERLTVPTRLGQLIPLQQVADIRMEEGPNQIQREDGRRRIIAGFNVRDRDIQSVVDEIRQRIDAEVDLPQGYEVTYGGAFENLNAAKSRLMIAVPAALLLILFLLYLTFGTFKETVLVFTAIPLSAVGGIAALIFRGMPFSISAGVGFIALFGVAVLNGIVLMAAFKKHADLGPLRTVLRGTYDRLRPVTMTALVASLGFLPMALSNGDGAEVQRPLATVVIGGLVSSTLLTLVVLPALYLAVSTWSERKRKLAATPLAVILLLGLSAITAHATDALSRQQIRTLINERNIDIRSARNQERQADVMKGAAVDLGKTQLQWMGGSYNANVWDNAFSIVQTVPWITQLTSASSLASERTRYAGLNAMLTQRMVLAEAERTMDQIAYAREVLRLIDRLDSLLERGVKVAEVRHQTGDVSTLALVNTQAQRSELTIQRETVTLQLFEAERKLRELCNDSAVTTNEDSLLKRASPVGDSLAGPIIQEIGQRVNVAQAEVDLAKSQWGPDLTLGYTNQSLIGTPMGTGRLATSDDRFSYITLGVHVPLWFGPTSARAEQTVLQRDLTRDASLAALRAREQQRAQLLREHDVLKRVLAHYEGPAALQLTTIATHAQRAFEAGEIDWLAYQQSIEQAVSIRRNHLESLLRYNDVVISLELLTKD